MFKIVSYFAGCGGLDLGFLGGFKYKDDLVKKLDFEVIAAYDNNEKCIKTYRENIGKHAAVLDLSTADPVEMPKADLLIGGFPCQDFSTCGTKKGTQCARGQLYKSLIRYMKAHKPKVVIAENVPNILKINGGETIKEILKNFSEAGYRFEIWNLYAPDYGVPQTRSRVFFIGVRKDIEGFPSIPAPTHKNYRSIDWAISDLMNIKDETIPNQSQYFKAKKAKNGNGQGDEVNKIGLPSYTIRSNAKSRIQYHHKLDRRLTIRECARLQTFPDSFTFPHSATSNLMQIGNAVPPILANQVARSILQLLRKY